MSRYYPQEKKKGGETPCSQMRNNAKMDSGMPLDILKLLAGSKVGRTCVVCNGIIQSYQIATQRWSTQVRKLIVEQLIRYHKCARTGELHWSCRSIPMIWLLCLKNIINTGQRWCWCSSSRYTCYHQTRQLPCCWNPILYPDCFLDVGKRAQPQLLDVDTWHAKFELWTCDFDFAEHSKTPLNVAWEFDKQCGNWQSHSVRDSTRLWKWLHIAQELFVAASA